MSRFDGKFRVSRHTITSVGGGAFRGLTRNNLLLILINMGKR